MRHIIAALVLGLLASTAFAQIIYEPVQYQFGTKDKYYYGGNDPSVFRHAANYPTDCRSDELVGSPTQSYLRVYSDHIPYRNAATFGCTPTDARNEAYANVPTYFRKADLLRTAIPAADGSLIVPARPASAGHYSHAIEIKPYVKPATSPRPILIIPKSLLRQQPADKYTASAE